MLSCQQSFSPATCHLSHVVELKDGSKREVRFRTEVVSENAFNPNFLPNSFVLPIVDSSNSFLSIALYSSDELIGFWCCKLESVRAGVRCCRLRDVSYRLLNKGMGHVLAKFTIAK